jgi:TonB family protein
MQPNARLLAAVLSCVSVVVAAPVGAAEPRTAPVLIAALNGYWRCRTDDGKSTERSYFAATAHANADGPLLKGHPAAVFAAGREDLTDENGDPVFMMERLDVHGSEVKAQSVEGTSDGTVTDDDALLLHGIDPTSGTPFTLRYAVGADSLQRTFTEGSVTRAEQCTREQVPAPPTTCAHPDVHGTTLQAAQPYVPAEAAAQRVYGRVLVIVTLNDRSQVVWVDVLKSASPLLNDAALAAARDSTYRTQIVHCRPIAANFIFSVDFDKP